LRVCSLRVVSSSPPPPRHPFLPPRPFLLPRYTLVADTPEDVDAWLVAIKHNLSILRHEREFSPEPAAAATRQRALSRDQASKPTTPKAANEQFRMYAAGGAKSKKIQRKGRPAPPPPKRTGATPPPPKTKSPAASRVTERVSVYRGGPPSHAPPPPGRVSVFRGGPPSHPHPGTPGSATGTTSASRLGRDGTGPPKAPPPPPPGPSVTGPPRGAPGR
jgi:hypothetical protein